MHAIEEFDFDTVVSATLYLMSRYAVSPNNELVNAICLHLDVLENHSQISSEVLIKSCRRLRATWLSILENQKYKPTNLPIDFREAQDIH